MNREEFINELNERLNNNPDKDDIISYYSELISDKIDSGYSESEAVESLGSIDLILENIKDNNSEEVEFKKEKVEEKIEEEIEIKEEIKDNSKKELSGGRKFVYVLFQIATILFCIAAVFIYVLTIIMIGVGGSLIGIGIYQFLEIKSFGLFIVGSGLFVLGAALAGIYYANILRKFVFGKRSEWTSGVRNSLAGE